MVRSIVAALFVFSSIPCVAADERNQKLDTNPERVRNVLRLSEPALNESSGLAFSNRRPDYVWSHNDSGGKPQLFAFNKKGERTGKCRLKNANARDWEDVATYQLDGRNYVVAADCGDNLSRWNAVFLYLFEETDPTESTTTDKYLEIEVQYSDGPHNCEAVAVDTRRKKICLITKEKLPLAGIFEVELPDFRNQLKAKKRSLTAKRVGALALPMISAMDIDSKSGDVWIINYFQAFRFSYSADYKSLAQQLASIPQAYELPRWRQIEAVAVDQKQQVWVTSEGESTPLGRLTLDEK